MIPKPKWFLSSNLGKERKTEKKKGEFRKKEKPKRKKKVSLNPVHMSAPTVRIIIKYRKDLGSGVSLHAV